jgi:hypothetical protein
MRSACVTIISSEFSTILQHHLFKELWEIFKNLIELKSNVFPPYEVVVLANFNAVRHITYTQFSVFSLVPSAIRTSCVVLTSAMTCFSKFFTTKSWHIFSECSSDEIFLLHFGDTFSAVCHNCCELHKNIILRRFI